MTAETDLPGLLAEHGIFPKSYAPGHTQRIKCPRCGGGKTREQCMAITIDADGMGATWICHRANCGWQDGERLAGARRAARPPPRKADVIEPPAEIDPTAQRRPAEMYYWWEERGISADTVNAFGIFTTTRWFPNGGEQSALAFPYTVAGKVVNRKYRSFDKQFVQEKNPLPSLFNIDAVTEPDVIVWVEGEADVMALHEAGYPQTVSLANGAPAELRDEDDPRREDDRRFLALRTHAETLNKVKKFILAGDNDGPGIILREELARRLGRHRCWLVEWPEGCKDAGDVLRAKGARAVQAAIEAATPYPIAGIRHIDDETMLDARYRTLPPTMTTGTIAGDRVLRLPTEGKLIIVTGYPGAHKSRWLKHVAVHTMMEHGRKWLIFSPEMQPWNQFAAMFAETWAGKPYHPGDGYPGFTREEVLAAAAWLRDRLVMLVTDSEDVAPTLDWILECAQAEVLRTGVTDLQIDPWNEIEHSRGNLTEAEYINRGLQRCKAFALRHGVNVWVVVHPAKPQAPRPGAKLEAPSMYDINGGAAWNNKADLGLVLHTPEKGTLSELHVRKSRFRRWANRGAMASLVPDDRTGRYSSAALADELDEKAQRRQRAGDAQAELLPDPEEIPD
jgi:twinkle protein